jgi:hypothetical protein
VVQRSPQFGLVVLAFSTLALLASCGGGGGGGDGGVDPPAPPADPVTVTSGFNGNLDWDTGGSGDGGVGAGADGDGGVGAGGDFGQFRGAIVTAWKQDGTLIGSAPTDPNTGMVTIKPGRTYRGTLRVQICGAPGASYYEEGRNEFVPFTDPNRCVRVVVPAVTRNIGMTPFTEAAYKLLTEGSTPERVNGVPTPAQVRAANERVRQILNQQFPQLLHVDDITRLPFIKSDRVRNEIGVDPRGRYGIVNGAFSKLAALHNSDRGTPTLDATRHLAEDLLDGQLDGRNGDDPAVPANERMYEPNTITGELSAALAEQAARFGAQPVLDVLPPIISFGNTRYRGYLFDGSVRKDGRSRSTVSGWVGENNLNFQPGEFRDRLPQIARVAGLWANAGHGGGFFKVDPLGPGRPRIFAIGDNVNGELGTGDTTPRVDLAVELTNLPGLPTHMAGGFAHTVARLANGEVYAWGDNNYGQLGQGAGGPASAHTPQRVTLPGPALAVAATNTASYALLADGTVWAWGSGNGFGLLGDGAANSLALAPTQVAGLANIVQIAARDNDVVVLRRDNTILHWGAYPIDASAPYPPAIGDPYVGGSFAPATITVPGVSSGVTVRKVITEQGLFAALLSNGHVYTWGVYFDITAGQVLRDTTPLRVLGLPPLRDMMPGGYIGYGVRAFDRLTATGIDYRGGMWKIRGRVAEVFDPDAPEKQRRPQGQGPRVDCIACHTFLDESLAELRARQPAESGTVCAPPESVHGNLLNGSLIHQETDCFLCHNPNRLNYASVLPQPFAGSGGWKNCVKPDNLPARSSIAPAIISTACTIPPGHVFTPPGTVCASCHAGIIARALRDLTPACAQPRASELPTIATAVSVGGAFNDGGGAIGALTNDRTPEIRGTLSADLAGSQSVAVMRNGAMVGTASVNARSWSFTDPAAPDGNVSYTARVVDGAGFGITSNAVAFVVDGTAPTATAGVTGFVDDLLGAIAPGTWATDTTPGVTGSLSTALGGGERLLVLRGGVVVGPAAVSGTSWLYTEPAALPPGSYTYQVQPEDAAGNRGALSAGATVTLLAGLPDVTIRQALNDANQAITNGGATADSTPTFSGTVSAAVESGWFLRVFRNGGFIGNATVSGLTWTLADPGAPDGSHVYDARVEAGRVPGGLSGGYAITVDTVAPTQTANVTEIADDFGNMFTSGGTTADTTPIVRGTLSASLAAGEQVRILRNGSAVGTATVAFPDWTYNEPSALTGVPPTLYAYRAQVVDAAGNAGALGTTQSVTIDAAGVPLQGAATMILTVNGVAPSGGAVPVNNNAQPVLAGSIQRALNAGEVVRVYRGLGAGAPAPVGNAIVTGTTWSYSNTTLTEGSYVFRAQIEVSGNPAVFGLSSASITNPIDLTPPPQTITIGGIFDGNNVAVNGGNTADPQPRISGNVSSTLGIGDALEILRTGASTRTLIPNAQNAWTLTEPTPLAPGVYTYTLRIRDQAGNVSVTQPSAAVTVIAPLPTVTGIAVSGAVGGFVGTTTPTVFGTISGALPGTPAPGAVVRVFRGGVSIGTAAIVNTTSFSIGDTTTNTSVPRTYTARVENGTAYSATSGGVTVTPDVTAPAQTVTLTVTAGSQPFNNAVGGSSDSQFASGTTSDPRPRIVVQLNGPLSSGGGTSVESLSLTRNGVSFTFSATGCPAGVLANSFCYIDNTQSSTLTSTPVVNPLNGQVNAPATAGLPNGGVVYRARVVDAVGNQGTQVATGTITTDYVNCNQARATAASAGHITIAGYTGSCFGCHRQYGGANTAAPTPSGTIIPVPQTTPSYFCRRP